jgi:hypothetical protein
MNKNILQPGNTTGMTSIENVEVASGKYQHYLCARGRSRQWICCTTIWHKMQKLFYVLSGLVLVLAIFIDEVSCYIMLSYNITFKLR